MATLVGPTWSTDVYSYDILTIILSDCKRIGTMATPLPCRRCGGWHDATAPCAQAAALHAFLEPAPDHQATADQLETIAVARYLRGQRR